MFFILIFTGAVKILQKFRVILLHEDYFMKIFIHSIGSYVLIEFLLNQNINIPNRFQYNHVK